MRCLIPAVLAGVALAAAAPPAAHAAATATDRAFVREMVPHHEMAVEMAKMAKMDASHKALRRLAGRIVAGQSAEIRTLRGIAKSLGVTPEPMPDGGQVSETMMRDLETLGVTEKSSGMSMDMSELRAAQRFDRTFIDMMIAHHAGAIRMARAEIAKGTNRALRKIARGIIRDQAKEIRQMNAWRRAWYGKSSPAGGVPTS